MIKNITSTELKQNLRKILDEVGKSSDGAVIVSTYNEPKVVIMNYELWVEKKEGVDAPVSVRKYGRDLLKKYGFRSKKTNKALKLIKFLRDE